MIRSGCREVSGSSIRIKSRHRCIDLRGKKVEGDILLVVREGGRLPWLRLDNATIDGSIHIQGEDMGGVPMTLPKGAVAQIEGRGLSLSGDLRIERVGVAGILLNNARIGGDLRLTSAHVSSLEDAQCRADRADAIRLRDARIEGSLFIRGDKAARRGTVDGRIFVAGGRIGGAVEFAGIDFTRAKIGASSKEAVKVLTLANANIGGDLGWLDNQALGGACNIQGHVNIDSCHVGGRLRIAVRTTGNTKFSLKACEVDAAVQLHIGPEGSAAGCLRVDARDAIVDAIHILGYDRAGWSLNVAGTTYGGLAGATGKALAGRADSAELDETFLETFLGEVVSRSAVDRHDGVFSPQPYQYFIALCRAEGFNKVADDAVEEWVKRAHADGPGQVIYRLFGWVSRYGLSPWRATWSCLLGLFFCAAMICFLQRTLPRAFIDPEPREAAASGTVIFEPGRPAVPGRYRFQVKDVAPNDFECASRVNALVYALDVMLPLADFRQESQCPPRGADRQDYRVGAAAILFALFRLVGAVLTAILLLTFSGINRRIWR